jgi:hypothetical protein
VKHFSIFVLITIAMTLVAVASPQHKALTSKVAPPHAAVLAFSPCDVNLDGQVNVADIQFEFVAIMNGVNTPITDVNGDGQTDMADLMIVYHTVLGYAWPVD